MTAEQFKAWQKLLLLSNEEAARLLEVSKRTIVGYRKNGGNHQLKLACMQLKREADEFAYDSWIGEKNE